MVSYLPLLNYLIKNNIPLGYLREELGISSSVVAKFKKGEYINLEIIERICLHFNLPIEEVVTIMPGSESDGKRE